MRVWTIGHGTRSADERVETFRESGVETLVDVRRFAGSRRNPQFARRHSPADCSAPGLPTCIYRTSAAVGRAFPKKIDWMPACCGVRSYAAWMSSSEWQQALAAALARDNPCFMCAETLPWRCHRRLIADLLAARHFEAVHLLGPGATVEQRPPFAEAEVRDGRLYLYGTLVA